MSLALLYLVNRKNIGLRITRTTNLNSDALDSFLDISVFRSPSTEPVHALDSWVNGVHLNTADARTLDGGDLNVISATPSSGPGVVDDVVLLSSLGIVIDGVIELSSKRSEVRHQLKEVPLYAAYIDRLFLREVSFSGVFDGTLLASEGVAG